MHPRECLIESPLRELERLERFVRLWKQTGEHEHLENFRRLTRYHVKRDKLRIPALLQDQAA